MKRHIQPLLPPLPLLDFFSCHHTLSVPLSSFLFVPLLVFCLVWHAAFSKIVVMVVVVVCVCMCVDAGGLK